ncbi:MAG TPA: ATP-binding protein [Atribacteraceae bacterium]|nr:ATP-binding protein [Atribacteraceae bacterium]
MAVTWRRTEVRFRRKTPLVVGFSGAAGVGKTTLVNRLADYFDREGYQVATVPEVAREVFALYRAIGEAQTLEELRAEPEMYLRYQADVCEVMIRREEQALASGAKLVLCDRTMVDNWLYALLYCTRRDGRAFDHLVCRITDYLATVPYHWVVFVPPHGKPLPADPGRAREDSDSQTVQDRLLRLLLGFYREQLVHLHSAEMNERYGYMTYLIREWLST